MVKLELASTTEAHVHVIHDTGAKLNHTYTVCPNVGVSYFQLNTMGWNEGSGGGGGWGEFL